MTSLQLLVSVAHDGPVADAFTASVRAAVERALARYPDRVTRVEVRFTDGNGAKGGATDKRCAIEVRLRGVDPVAVTHEAPTRDLALQGAISRLRRALARAIGKRRPPKGLDPFAQPVS